MGKPGSENGIVRIVTGDASSGTQHVGMGILFAKNAFLTCAHVVNVAAGQHEMTNATPDAKVMVSFPIMNDDTVYEAEIVDWSPPGRSGLDCAILKLPQDAPPEVGIAILSSVDADDVFDDALSIYGSTGPGHPGKHISARLLGQVGAGWSQINVEGHSGVQPGFSGGAVWDRDQRAAIGMIIARKHDEEGAIGYSLSAARMAERFEQVPVEIRRVSLRRQRSFTLVAVLLFFLMLIHFIANRSAAAVEFVPWLSNSKLLAAFFGAHCFAVILGPYVMWHAYKHARSFACRDWWQRVPAFSLGRHADMLDNSRIGAAMTVLFLLLLPAVAQGTFLREMLFDDGHIYVNVERFKPASETGKIACNPKDKKWCTHEKVGAWRFFARKPYFDHAYQFGENCHGRPECRMVTFFPALHPAVLMAGTGIAYLWFFLFLAALLAPNPFVVERRAKEP